MAKWNKGKADPSKINGGNQFTSDDILAVDELNAMVNNSFYAVDFVEAMADAPDVSDIDGTGTPSVSLVSNGGFKKFKFSNLRGSQGLKGDTGDKGEKGDKGDTGATNSLSIGSVVTGTEASATITGTAPNQVLNLVLPKGEKGDKGDTGDISDGIIKIKELNIAPISSNITSWDSNTTVSYPYAGLTYYKKFSFAWASWQTIHNAIKSVGLVNIKAVSFEGFPTVDTAEEEFFTVQKWNNSSGAFNWGYHFIGGDDVVVLEYNNGEPKITIYTRQSSSLWSANFKIKNLYYF